MKSIVIYIGLFFSLINLFFGIVLSSYKDFNLIISTTVIVVSTAFNYLLFSTSIKDGFKIPLLLATSVSCLFMFILSLFMNNNLYDNVILLSIISIMILQILTLIVFLLISKKT